MSYKHIKQSSGHCSVGCNHFHSVDCFCVIDCIISRISSDSLTSDDHIGTLFIDLPHISATGSYGELAAVCNVPVILLHSECNQSSLLIDFL